MARILESHCIIFPFIEARMWARLPKWGTLTVLSSERQCNGQASLSFQHAELCGSIGTTNDDNEGISGSQLFITIETA